MPCCWEERETGGWESISEVVPAVQDPGGGDADEGVSGEDTETQADRNHTEKKDRNLMREGLRKRKCHFPKAPAQGLPLI